jgi:hypothetical protein
MWNTYKVFEPFICSGRAYEKNWQPVTIALVDPDFDSRMKTWVTAWLQTTPLCSTTSYAVDVHMPKLSVDCQNLGQQGRW